MRNLVAKIFRFRTQSASRESEPTRQERAHLMFLERSLAVRLHSTMLELSRIKERLSQLQDAQ